MEVSRRQFLKVVGGATGGMVLMPSILDGSLKALAQSDINRPTGWEKTLYQFCGVCASACGMRAYVRDGRIEWLDGNPADSLGGHGGLCAKGASALNMLYDPDRLKYPLKRTNPKKGKNEDPGWVKISWEEAFEAVGEGFNKSIADYGPESIIIFSRTNDPCTRLQYAIGTPNQMTHLDTCYTSHDIAWRTMVSGTSRTWTMDLENARYILSFGWDMPGKSKLCQTVPFMKAKEKGAKIVVFDPRLSFTASKADEWIPIKPATDLAVALAMIHVIINEELYDKDFVDNYTYGFDELKKHVNDNEYTPAWAAEKSEVPAADITRIAREFATTKPALLATHKRDGGGPLYANSFPTAQAQLILSALVGGIERKGTFFLNRRFSLPSMDSFAPVAYPDRRLERVDGQHLFPIANARRSGNFGHVTEGMLSGDPYPVKAGLANAYSLLAFPNPDEFIEALKTLDFLAVVDVMPSEFCQMADIVLPEPHFLERGGYSSRAHMALWPQIMLREGLGALWDGKGWSAIVNGILDAMGKPEFKVNWSGLTAASLAAAGTSVEHLRANNGIWEDKKEPVGRTTFNTPSDKIELYSQRLAAEGYDPLPSWQEPFVWPTDQYPYRLLTHHLPWQAHTQLTNSPLVLELQPENLAHIHPDTADKVGVKEGDYVMVESPTGKALRIRAHITKGIRRDCVMTEHHFGHWSKELKLAHNKGTNEGDLLPDRHIEDSLKIKSHLPCHSSYFTDVCVSLRKA